MKPKLKTPILKKKQMKNSPKIVKIQKPKMKMNSENAERKEQGELFKIFEKMREREAERKKENKGKLKVDREDDVLSKKR